MQTRLRIKMHKNAQLMRLCFCTTVSVLVRLDGVFRLHKKQRRLLRAGAGGKARAKGGIGEGYAQIGVLGSIGQSCGVFGAVPLSVGVEM